MGTAAWYQFLHQTATALAAVPAAELALQLFLACAQSASEEAGLEVTAYEFLEQVGAAGRRGAWVGRPGLCRGAGRLARPLPSRRALAPPPSAAPQQAFLLYEEAIPDSRGEARALASILGTLNACYVFGPEERGALAHKAAAYCAKLLRRTDQCLAALACSHLHWQPEREGRMPTRDEAAVLACLKRALKAANAAQQQARAAGAGWLLAGKRVQPAPGVWVVGGAACLPVTPAPSPLALPPRRSWRCRRGRATPRPRAPCLWRS